MASLLPVQRQPGADHDLRSPRFAKQPLLEQVFDGTARVRGGSDPDAVRRIQEALRDVTKKTGKKYDLGKSGPKGDGVDGVYGSLTGAAVRKFKIDHALGSTEFTDVGPGTMGKLDELFRDEGPGPTPPPPPAPTATPTLEFLVIEERRGPTASIQAFPPDFVVLGGREIPTLDCDARFIARLVVAPQHKGRIFFRQFLMSTTRKEAISAPGEEEACRRGPRGIVKGPGLDTKLTYNHKPGELGSTGELKVGGATGPLTMTDADVPSQVPTAPICNFDGRAKSEVALFASDVFRLVVMWAPEGGAEVALGHKDWSWGARGGFTKDRGDWLPGVSDPHGPSAASTFVQPGEQGPTDPTLLGPNLMDDAAPVAKF